MSDNFVVFFQDNQGVHVLEYDSPRKALVSVEAHRQKGRWAYAAHLGTVIDYLPDTVLLEVEATQGNTNKGTNT